MKRLLLRALVRHLVRRPGDAVVLVRAAWPLRRRFWWARPPFLPVPGAKYWEFRMSTALGHDGELSVGDAVAAARWSLRQRRTR